MRQFDLAKQVKVGQSAVSGWENNLFDPSGESLVLLAKIFDVSIDYLLCHTDIKKTPTSEDVSALTPKQLEIIKMMEHMTPEQQTELVRQAEYQIWMQKQKKDNQ